MAGFGSSIRALAGFHTSRPRPADHSIKLPTTWPPFEIRSIFGLRSDRSWQVWQRRELTSIAPFHNLYVMEQSSYGRATSRRLNLTFAALANPTRRAILARLASGEVSVSELAEPFAMTQPAISRHLRVLERAGLISSASDAQRRPRKLDARPLAEATEWLEAYRKYWEASFVRLDALLGELKATDKKRKRSTAKLR
jgi:DNA-binding transcriptional ArsR family regulator